VPILRFLGLPVNTHRCGEQGTDYDLEAMIQTLTKIFVAVNALVWLALGPASYFAPVDLAARLDIALTSPTAIADFRAMYGGVPLGIGIFLVMGLRRREWMKPALMLIALATSGLLLGRVITMAQPGEVGTIIYVFAALEALAVVGAVWLYRAIKP
jgi:hypothetical protein